ncbi:MAG TPA: DUF1634 domain-containing protein [Acidimicrobiales bacterium]|nr:DUF1634 domain-containing protein [Acidimicrobiales bacterium]
MSTAPETSDPLHYEPPAAMARLEAAVTVVLRIGLALSMAVLVVGTLVTLAAASTSAQAGRTVGALRHGAAHPGGLAIPRSVGAVARGLAHGQGPAIVLLGVLLLVLTPISRVAVSAVVYAREHDTTFVVISVVVFALLVASFALG